MKEASRWVVPDSDDEEPMLLDIVQPASARTTTITSPISDFSAALPANKKATAEITSSASQFTVDVSKAQTSTSTDAIMTPPAPPNKPKRPKPRPAYKAAREAAAAAVSTSMNVISSGAVSNESGQASSVVPTELVSSRPHSLSVEPRSSIASASKSSIEFEGVVLTGYSSMNPPEAAISRVTDVVIDISSDDDSHGKSRLSTKAQRKPIFRVPDAPMIPSSSMLPPSKSPSTVPSSRPSSPVFGAARRNSTPPSSPIIVRPKKRKAVVLDDEDFISGSSASVIISGTSNSKEKSRKKTAAPQKKGKGKAKKETNTDVASPRPAKTKARNKDEEQPVFKSREFIEDSDEDDLLLRPNASSSHKPKQSSVPSETFPPSHSVAPEADSSVLPSIPASVRPTAPASVPPSVDVSDPPSSNIDGKSTSVDCSTEKRESRPSRSKSDSAALKKDSSKKKKKKDVAEAAVLEGVSGSYPNARRSDLQASESIIPSASPSSKPPSPRTDDMPLKPKQTKRAVIDFSDEDEPILQKKPRNPEKTAENSEGNKENDINDLNRVIPVNPPPTPFPQSSARRALSSTPCPPTRRDSMSLLIRRASDKVHSPLGSPSSKYIHSPLAKSSRVALSKMAPLHPNIKTPPPAPPKPPPPKKTKKMLDMEEKWEEELAESVEGWSCLTDEERAALRRAKRDAELGYED